MADAPWRCSQCGTVNEPVANACRTCGRWPSLFELEGSTIEADAPSIVDEDEFPAETVDVEAFEPEDFEAEVEGDAALPPEFEEGEEESVAEKSRWRALARLIIPIGVVIYILVKALVERG